MIFNFLHRFFKQQQHGLDPVFFANLIKKKDPVIVEIGCNDGSHTLEFLGAFPNGKIICFEPDERAAKRFKKKVNDPRVVFFSCAIGSVDGTARFFASGGNPLATPDPRFPEDWDLSGSIHPPLLHLQTTPRVTFANQVEVTIQRLDSMIQELGLEKVDLIWADVQGAEADLIWGGRQTLRNTHYFYTEYSDQELYAGQVNLNQLRTLLPDFRLIHKLRYDVLFRNKNFV
jgi:FkbM family methyltransferase